MKLAVKIDTNYKVEDITRDKITLDWIETYKSENLNKLPSSPAFLLPLINNYVQGQPISKDIVVIPISGQQWQEMTAHQRNELLELVEFTGGDADDYMKLVQSQYPKTPRGK